jgi:uncharacterized membrane protein YesL
MTVVREFGEGPLARMTALVYSLVVVNLLVLLTALPGLVPLVLLAPDASNAPLVALFAIPLGPALSAALFALHQHRGDLADLRPFGRFWRGYRLNAVGALQIWIPYLVGMTVIAVNLAHPESAGVPGWWATLLVVIALVASLWVVNALVITSLYAFRTRDVARLAGYFLGRTKSVAIGNAGLLVIAAGITYFTSEAVLALFGSVLAYGVLVTSRPMIAVVRTEFTAA